MLKKINFILDRGQKTRLIILIFIILGGSFLELLGVSAILPLINVVVNINGVKTSIWYIYLDKIFDIRDPKDAILILSGILIVVYIVKNIYLAMMYSTQYRYTFNNQQRIASKLMKSYMNEEYLFHVSKNVAELQRNVWQDVNYFFVAILNFLQLFAELSVCTVLIIFLMATDVVTTLSVSGLIVVFIILFGLFFKKRSIEYGKKNRFLSASLNKWIIQSFSGIKEIKVANKEQYFLDNFDNTYKEWAAYQRKQSFIGMIPRPVMESFCICGLLITMSIKIYFGTEISSFIPVLSVFAIAAFRMLPSFNRITGYISTLMYYKSAIESVYNDLKGVDKSTTKVASNDISDNRLVFSNEIKIDDISFRYPNVNNLVLENVNFIIPKDKSIAFIGTSGSGKTTLADVILGILKPTAGKICVDGIDICENYCEWHNMIGYIPQSIYLIDDTIKANVAFGIPQNKIDNDKLWSALKRAQLDKFVSELELGIETEVGDRGVKLSGGQRQRIGIARALYNEPEILVLDEATSALDTDTEKAVMESIDNLQGDTTLIIIAHRLTTIKNCDLIYEISNGHAHLKSKSELFD